MMNLATVLDLKRPLTVLDVETTGVSVQVDRIVQISITVHYPDKEPVTWVSYVNPGIPIPPQITEKHGITDAMVEQAPAFSTFAAQLARTALGSVDYCGQNVHFDLRMIRAEMQRANVDWDFERSDSLVIDTLKIEQRYHNNSLSSIYKRRTGKTLEGAHDAGVDVAATTEILIEQLTQETELPRTVRELSALCFPVDPTRVDKAGKFVWRGRVVCFGFGKHSGKPVKEQLGYVQWMLDSNFDAETHVWCTRFLSGEFPEPGE